jgi:curved DNA-binding protein CbpA
MRRADCYAVLGVAPDESPDGIRHAYRLLVRRHHPDAGAADAERFRELTEAYEVLSDPERRRRYDASLPRPPRTGAWPDAEPLAAPGTWPDAEPLAPHDPFRDVVVLHVGLKWFVIAR